MCILGYMDLAVAPYNSDNWITLATLQDEYLHEKYRAQNFTAVVVSYLDVVLLSH